MLREGLKHGGALVDGADIQGGEVLPGRIARADTIARFDASGLWSYRDIHFSRHGADENPFGTEAADVLK